MNLTSFFKALLKRILKVFTGYSFQKTQSGIITGCKKNIEPNFLSSSCAILVEKSNNEVEKTWLVYKYLYQSRLKAIIEKYNINLIIDVGANEGQFANLLRAIGYQNQIISFEPVSSAFNLLLEKSQKDANWNVYQMALGNENITKEIYVTADSVFSSFLETSSFSKEKFTDNVAQIKTETVNLKRLDSFFNENSIDLSKVNLYLKMDTQGYDLEVFKGLGKLQHDLCAFQTEMSVIPLYENMIHFTDSISYFENKGFKLTGIYPVSQDRQSLKMIEFDCIFQKD